MSQRAHGDVVSGPWSDPGQGHPAGDEVVQHALAVEVHTSVQYRARDGAHGVGARAGQADAGEVGFGQRFRRGEKMMQPGCETFRQRFAELLRQSCRERTSGRHADLLADDGAHGDLEAVPAAGQTQARTFFQQRPQARIVRQRGGDGMRIRIQVEHAPQAVDDVQQPCRRHAVQLELQGMLVVRPRAHPQPSRRGGRADHARIAVLVHRFHPGQGAAAQEIQHGDEVVRRPITQPQYQRAFLGDHGLPTQIARRHPVGFQEGGVESPHAAEARSQGHFGNRQTGFGQQLFGEQQPARAMHADRRGAQPVREQPAQLALAQAHALGQCRQRLFGQYSLIDQFQCACDRFVAASPGAVTWRKFRAAAQAWPVAGRFGGGSIAVIGDVDRFGGGGRAHRAAIDASAFHCDEEQPVEARIAAQTRLFADAWIQ